MNPNKPVVYFTNCEIKELYRENIKVGETALIEVLDHPRFRVGEPVITSRVLHIFEDGSFETRNTIYRPAKAVTKEIVDGQVHISFLK